ncbi:acetyl-CoA C-acetyltransferase [Rickettsiales bacterium]|nr:acetyl-CoA C-acetyltransferase [Rickettsiales bacterium]
MTEEVVIVEAVRTPIGNFNGDLASLPANKLGEIAIKALFDRTKLDASNISEVIMGQVLTAACGQNPARQASIGAGIPQEVPAYTINHVCGSGLKTVMLGYQSIISGQNNIVIAGGQESMSQAPHAVHMRNGTKMGNASLVDTVINDGLWEAFNNYHMGTTAENIASQFDISRQSQDEFACSSQNKAEAAQNSGAFDKEIIPVTVPNRKGDIIVEKDQFPKSGVTVEALAKLRPAFSKDGTITAGNASGINDGAAAIMLMTKAEAEKRGLKPLAKIVSFGQAGVDPKIMGTGPINASKNALDKAGWSVDDLDLIEANEAFAAQAICVNRQMGWDIEKVNINGGAIALGHPIGASGTRVLVSLIFALHNKNLNKGLATLCIGGGMGIAVCIERL